jgi:DNA-directed RNA polymerase specialized sigma24 family protein
VLDDDKRAVIAARRSRGESVREIAAAVGVSASTVWNALSEAEAAS